MPNIFLALLGVHSLPELRNPINQLFFRCWLYFPSDVFLKFMPQIFYWIEVWRLGGCLPPVDPLVFQVLLCMLRRMFGVVVLHEPVASREVFVQKWDQRLVKNLGIQWCVHFAFKDANFSWAFLANTCPNVNFWWMLGPEGKKETGSVWISKG